MSIPTTLSGSVYLLCAEPSTCLQISTYPLTQCTQPNSTRCEEENKRTRESLVSAEIELARLRSEARGHQQVTEALRMLTHTLLKSVNRQWLAFQGIYKRSRFLNLDKDKGQGVSESGEEEDWEHRSMEEEEARQAWVTLLELSNSSQKSQLLSNWTSCGSPSKVTSTLHMLTEKLLAQLTVDKRRAEV